MEESDAWLRLLALVRGGERETLDLASRLIPLGETERRRDIGEAERETEREMERERDRRRLRDGGMGERLLLSLGLRV